MENNTTARRYRVGLDLKSYYKKMFIACLICLVIGVGATAVAGYVYFYDHDASLQAAFDEELSKVYRQEQEEKDKLRQAIVDKEHENDDELAEAAERERNLQEQLDEVTRLHQAEIETSAADFALLRKYWYVCRDAPNNGTITLDVLRYADDQCKKWDINPHWLWHMYEHESQWITTEVNSGSGARGIGQVLPSTGRSYWEQVLGHGKGSFNVAMLDDPYVNIEITTAHLGRDLQNGSTWKEAVGHYCGGNVNAYWNVVVGYAKDHGITLTENNYHYQ